MSSKVFGLTSSSLVAGPNFTASQEEEGKWRATHTFTVRRSAFDVFTGQTKLTAGTRATALDPTLPQFWSFMRLANVSTQDRPGGMSEITVNYVGYYSFNENSGGSAPVRYFLDGTLEEASIMEHPDVAALGAEERAYLQTVLDGRAFWDSSSSSLGDLNAETGAFTAWGSQPISTTVGKNFAEEIQNGNTTYKRPSYMWTKSWQSTTELASADLNNLGKIDTPDGSPPEAGSNRDWMMVNVSQTQNNAEESVYDITISWLLSDNEGWNSTIYS